MIERRSIVNCSGSHWDPEDGPFYPHRHPLNGQNVHFMDGVSSQIHETGPAYGNVGFVMK